MIYLHVPFCRSFCTYCDFYSRICAGPESRQVQNFIRRVLTEIDARRDEIAAARAASVHTLYFGGGTPSVLSLDQLGALTYAIVSALPGPASALPDPAVVMPGSASVMPGSDRASLFDEFTVEVNPDDITPEYARGLRALGVNRVSMGVQSWDDGILRWMNRRHDAAGARRAFAALREGGIDNISLDLIFGLSQLSDKIWSETLRETVMLRPEHISAYQLSVEPGSALGREARTGRYREISDDAAARQYAMLCETLAAAGYVHYEVSNFALPGREAVHNSAYWRRLPYVGLGPAAHSFDGTRRSWNNVRADWLSASPHSGPEASRHSRPVRESENSETLSEAEAREEAIMLGLRTAAGIPASLLAAPAGPVMPAAPAASVMPGPDRASLLPAAERLLTEGALVRLPGDRLRIPESHFFVSDDIISSLL